jgi:hypothetical protein
MGGKPLAALDPLAAALLRAARRCRDPLVRRWALALARHGESADRRLPAGAGGADTEGSHSRGSAHGERPRP